MHIEYTGRQTEVPPEIRDLAERKLAKLDKVLGGITDVHVVLAVDKHRHIAEVNVRSPRLSLLAAEQSTDLALSLSTVIDKLTRQAQKRVGRIREKKRRTPAKETALWTSVLAPAGGGEAGAEPAAPAPPEAGAEAAPAAEEAATHRVVQTRRTVVQSLTLAQATQALEGADEPVLVYLNAENNHVNVLFRRADGTLGIVEPEV